MSRKRWVLDMLAEPIVPAWTNKHDCNTNGAELQRAILRGFSEGIKDPIHARVNEEFAFEKELTFKEHGEFFRGALTMAGLRYTNDFYELLQRYGKIKVTIKKFEEEEV